MRKKRAKEKVKKLVKAKRTGGKKNRKKSMKISKNIKISDLLSRHPKLAEFFMQKGLFCFSCPMASIETLGQLCKSYGIDWREFKKEIEEFLKKK